MGKVKNLKGQRFGRLTVLEQQGFTKTRKQNYALWLCRCDCGKYCKRSTDSLSEGVLSSCGCENYKKLKRMSKENITHGMSKTPLYRYYYGIMRRCYNPNNDHYHMYGGRGIVVCEEWKSNFEAFRDWAFANGYKEGLSIDRIDVNGNYEPSNCRWIDPKEQCHNKRQSRLYEYNGKVQDISQWAEEYGLKYDTLWGRLNRGWDIETALTKEIDTRCWHGNQAYSEEAEQERGQNE